MTQAQFAKMIADLDPATRCLRASDRGGRACGESRMGDGSCARTAPCASLGAVAIAWIAADIGQSLRRVACRVVESDSWSGGDRRPARQ